jgi:predicted O-methyltransferase YrrM
MSWLCTQMKPVKLCFENPAFPLAQVFTGIDWKLAGGTKQAGILAATMICALDVDTVVEIGMWQGFTSAILGRALACNAGKDGLLLSIDIKAQNAERGYRQTCGLGIEHRTVVKDSMEVDLAGELAGRRIGLAFVDGNHLYEFAQHDIELCAPLLKTNGVLMVHDYSKGFPGVYRAVNEFRERSNWPMFFLDENRKSTDYRTAVFQNRGAY